ncbi:MAG: UDP-N-acetylmuramoyl-L-alanine--D-glutamate ligase, partial [Candidatus Moranbacteria bacterium]|nr:UDP-N-acetylmuramoyl-L-alanine--D-glutamate ligase [Candidatus Moranbacteria bacterium]
RLDFGPLAEEILRKAKGAVFFEGPGTERLLREIRSRLPEPEKDRRFETVSDMGKAVELAYRSAEPGDIVLLSPGAASFSLFQNEFDRGEQFQEAVRNGIMKNKR